MIEKADRKINVTQTYSTFSIFRIDADGYRRTVDYTADPVNGFNAIVNREPLGQAVAVAPVAAKVR